MNEAGREAGTARRLPCGSKPSSLCNKRQIFIFAAPTPLRVLYIFFAFSLFLLLVVSSRSACLGDACFTRVADDKQKANKT